MLTPCCFRPSLFRYFLCVRDCGLSCGAGRCSGQELHGGQLAWGCSNAGDVGRAFRQALVSSADSSTLFSAQYSRQKIDMTRGNDADMCRCCSAKNLEPGSKTCAKKFGGGGNTNMWR